MKHTYYVVYLFDEGHGSIQIDSGRKINNIEDIRYIEELIKDTNKIKGTVVLLNWIKLRTKFWGRL
jgi:hypothetical protein